MIIFVCQCLKTTNPRLLKTGVLSVKIKRLGYKSSVRVPKSSFDIFRKHMLFSTASV